MQLTPQITFKGLDHSDAVAAKVIEKIAHLEKFYNRIMSCRVVVEQSGKHHRKDNLFHVRVDLKLPGGELVVARSPSLHKSHKDVYVAIRDAFKSTQRELQDYVGIHFANKPRIVNRS